MKLFGADLAKQIVKNAQTAGQYLCEKGLKVLGESLGFTKSHQIAVDVRSYGGGKVIAQKLEDANIVLNKNLLPYDDQNNREDPSGLRIGFQDVTRRGFKETNVKHMCDLMLDVITGKRKPSDVKSDVIAFRQQFKTYGILLPKRRRGDKILRQTRLAAHCRVHRKSLRLSE